jgi:flagellar biogenesis protein FliO
VNTILATSCFPNCHPAGQQVSGFQASGNLALAAAIVCLLLLVVMKVRGK